MTTPPRYSGRRSPIKPFSSLRRSKLVVRADTASGFSRLRVPRRSFSPYFGNFSSYLAILLREVLCSYPLDMSGKRESSRSTRESFEREVLPHLDSIYSMALRLARNPDDANDLLQDTVLRAYRFFHQFTPGTNSRAWVLTIS